jgi:hypothetical protein
MLSTVFSYLYRKPDLQGGPVSAEALADGRVSDTRKLCLKSRHLVTCFDGVGKSGGDVGSELAGKNET